VASERIEDHARLLPNQGVRHSLRNGVILAMIGSSIISVTGVPSVMLSEGLSEGLSFGLSYGLSDGLHDMLIFAVCGGLLVLASRGGLAVLRHECSSSNT